MADNSTEFIGASIDGLRDRFYSHQKQFFLGDSFYLSDVVLPESRTGGVLVCEEAEQSRVNSGLPWPDEAQFPNDINCLRRIPVSFCWRLLIDGHKVTTCNSSEFEISKLLADHITKRAGDLRINGSEELCLAIPNDLPEFAQERLRKNLLGLRVVKPDRLMFVWRPVAAALSWLDKVQDELTSLSDRDYVLVVHIGPDAFEVVPLRLIYRVARGKRYVIPVRDLSKETLRLTLSGCDVIDNFIAGSLNISDFQARWRALTGIEDLWLLLGQRPLNQKKHDVWFRDGEWSSWSCDPLWKDTLWQSHVGRGNLLGALSVDRVEKSGERNWREYILNSISKQLSVLDSPRIRGVILSGSLLSNKDSFLTEGLLDLIRRQGLRSQVSSKPEADTIWLPTVEKDIVAEGAGIFAYRKHNNIPAYLDTLAQISILVEKRGMRHEENLLPSDNYEIDGGEVYQPYYQKVLSLPKGYTEVSCYLRRAGKLKKANFSFPAAPESSVPLDLKLTLASSYALAQVELIPENRDFLLEGQRIFMDFSKMEDVDQLPEFLCSFPPIIVSSVDVSGSRMKAASFRNMLESFFSSSPGGPGYVPALKDITQEIKTARGFVAGKPEWRYIVDQQGSTGSVAGDEVIKRITEKLDHDFLEMLKLKVRNRDDVIKTIIAAATWLYGGCPQSIRRHVFEVLKTADRGWHWGERFGQPSLYIHASARAAQDVKEFSSLYETPLLDVNRRQAAGRAPLLPLYWSQALVRILSRNEISVDCLSQHQLDNILTWALSNIQRGIYEGKLSVLAGANRLILFLLRARIAHRNFLDKNLDAARHKKVIGALSGASKFCETLPRHNRAAERTRTLIIEINKYIHNVGSEKLPEIILEDFLEGDSGDEE
ncbi:MAG: hypothetical protein WCH62_05980 [Candidatus Omnitrophota bacterium]